VSSKAFVGSVLSRISDGAGNILTSILDGVGVRRMPVDALISSRLRDAFGRVRVSEPYTIFDSKQINDAEPLHFVTSTTGTGAVAYSNARSATTLSVAASGDRAVRQTKRYFNYQSGKSLLVFITSTLRGQVANVSKRFGLYDDLEGIYFEMTGTGKSWNIRTSLAATNTVLQADWSVDKLNGTGASGITLNAANAQIMFLDLEWLGVGIVRVGFVIDGELIYCHEFKNANNLDRVYMRTPNLPIRWEIVATGVPGAGTKELEAICCSIQTEGGYSPRGVTRVADRDSTVRTIATANQLQQIVGVRLKASPYNRVTAFPQKMSILVSSSAAFRWYLILNPTFTGGTAATWTALTNSALEFDIARTGVVSGGTVVAGGYASTSFDATSDNFDNHIPLSSDFAGTTRDEYVLAAAATSANEDFLGSLTMLEQP
jgi:hypothetical protein